MYKIGDKVRVRLHYGEFEGTITSDVYYVIDKRGLSMQTIDVDRESYGIVRVSMDRIESMEARHLT